MTNWTSLPPDLSWAPDWLLTGLGVLLVVALTIGVAIMPARWDDEGDL